MRTDRLLVIAAVAGCLLMTLGVASAAAASSSIECGQLTGYTAPDPVGPTDGSLQLGLVPVWEVLATATVSPAAAAALPTIVNSGPTCLALDLDDDGKVTAIDFAGEGTIRGPVTFDSGSGFYIFDDRLIVPTFVTDAQPGLAALFATSYQAGTELTVTFSVDPATGQFVGVDGDAAFCGAASVDSDGNGHVGDAVIPAAVLDDDDRAALEGAGDRPTCAAVHASGTIDIENQGAISMTTDVLVTVAAPDATSFPTAPPTSVEPVDSTEGDRGGSIAVVLVTLLLTASAIAVKHFRSELPARERPGTARGRR